MGKDEGIKKKYVLWQINICSQFGCERMHKKVRKKERKITMYIERKKERKKEKDW